MEPLKLDYTLRLAHMVKRIQEKKRGPRAIREIKALATKVMSTSDVRIDNKLNEAVWSKGIRNLPTRLRVRFNRKRNESSDASEAFYTVVEFVECKNFNGLVHQVVTE